MGGVSAWVGSVTGGVSAWVGSVHGWDQRMGGVDMCVCVSADGTTGQIS